MLKVLNLNSYFIIFNYKFRKTIINGELYDCNNNNKKNINKFLDLLRPNHSNVLVRFI